MKTIRKILIANRGEIASRIMRTARQLGVETVAVYSEADAEAPFVQEADEAILIGPAPSNESYLVIDKIIEAAKRTGADAIHPGFGFLSENAEFAEACAKAGVIFIGPTPEAIRAMGLKREAKIIAEKSGLPVIPGYDGADQDPANLREKALEIGFPLLLKASAGGGGKGMKLVRREEELDEGIASARREAEAAFGNGTLIIERYIESPRHVEIQILGDAYGHIIHLNERECSIQRRHQKIVEESPSPALDAELRAKMGEAAVAIAKAIGYQNAGTVEFILDPEKRFYFLEVNTRLQVEHPVTECVTGLDLVAQQIAIAEGRPLQLQQDEVKLEGAAIEVRLYAEDPDAGFLPQSGKLVDFSMPSLEGIRVDTGVGPTSEIPVHYDPMIAKIIAHGADRQQAIRRLRYALRQLSVHGIRTNRELLLYILDNPAFSAGNFDTHFIERELGETLRTPPSEEAVRDAFIGATLALSETRRRALTRAPRGIPAGFRNNPQSRERIELALGDESVEIAYRFDKRAGLYRLALRDADHEARLVSLEGEELIFVSGDRRRRARFKRSDDRVYLLMDGDSFEIRELPRFPEAGAESVEGGYLAPMPGKIIQLLAAVDEEVEPGATLAVMEAMKMEHRIVAKEAATIREVRVKEGDQVEADAVLFVVEPKG